jgi:hypothetical protein
MGQDEIHSPHPVSVDEEVAQKGQYRDADEALTFLRYNETGDEQSLVDEKALVKKIDWMIVPLMFACYFLQYMDKSLRTFVPTFGPILRVC